MNRFFKCFDSFENFIDYFMFNAFVYDKGSNGKKNYIPIDIVTGEPFNRNEARDFQIGKKLSELNLKSNELRKILWRVQKMTFHRTLAMEEVIEATNQNNYSLEH